MRHSDGDWGIQVHGSSGFVKVGWGLGTNSDGYGKQLEDAHGFRFVGEGVSLYLGGGVITGRRRHLCVCFWSPNGISWGHKLRCSLCSPWVGQVLFNHILALLLSCRWSGGGRIFCWLVQGQLVGGLRLVVGRQRWQLGGILISDKVVMDI